MRGGFPRQNCLCQKLPLPDAHFSLSKDTDALPQADNDANNANAIILAINIIHTPTTLPSSLNGSILRRSVSFGEHAPL